jgi:hypothetical protein
MIDVEARSARAGRPDAHFFEEFWGEGEAAESGSADRPNGGWEPAKGTRAKAKGTKLGR